MTKRLNYTKRTSCIIPGRDMGVLLNAGELRQFVKDEKPRDRHKTVAFLYSMYSSPELVTMLGIKPSYVQYCAKKHREITEAAQLGRNFTIADISERRVIELLQTMDVGKMTHDKMAQAARYLMEVADLARAQYNPDKKENEETTSTTELVFRLQQRMKKEPVAITDNEKISETNNEN